MSTDKDKNITGCLNLFFENRNNIIEMISKNFINQNLIANREIIEENTNVIKKILKIYKRLIEQFQTCNPIFFDTMIISLIGISTIEGNKLIQKK